MTKKIHIITIGYQTYATSSITSAAKIIDLLTKCEDVTWNIDGPNKNQFTPTKKGREITLTLNQPYIKPPHKSFL